LRRGVWPLSAHWLVRRVEKWFVLLSPSFLLQLLYKKGAKK
jgi:hypothetical protein